MRGSDFAKSLFGASGDEWEAAILKAADSGDCLVWPTIKVPCGTDSYFFAMADYFAIGQEDDFIRVPVGGPTAQALCDRYGLLLPTPRMVLKIWQEASKNGVIIEPISQSTIGMTSVPAFYQHNNSVSKALAAAGYSPGKSLVGGVKKNVTISPQMATHPGMLSFYGWFRKSGSPIQGNSFAHVQKYFDYSHGAQGVEEMMVVAGKSVPVLDVLADPKLCSLLSGDGPLKGIRYGIVNSLVPSTIKLGSKGPDVAKWQSILGVTADGDFGPKTDVATKSWQKEHGLTADGVVGPKTWELALSTSALDAAQGPAPPPLTTSYPFVKAKSFGTLANRKIRMIVIHTMEWGETNKTAENCAAFFQNPKDAKGNPVISSAHFCVDDDSIIQCVRKEDVAWHTPGKLGTDYINNYSIGVEHAGYANQTAAQWADAYSEALLKRSADLVADLCLEYGIPIRKLSVEELKSGTVDGICGHVDCTKSSGSGSHIDPGPNFPWAHYLDLLNLAYAEKTK